MIYTYEKEVSPEWLEDEIRASIITVALVGITLGVQTEIEFKASLTTSEQETLDLLVDNHIIKPSKKESMQVVLDSVKDNIVQTQAFASTSGFRFRGTSFKGTALANSVTDLDYVLPADRFINGGRLLIDSVGQDDMLTVQVVDENNMFGLGAGAVLDEFISGYYVPSNGNLEVKLDYPARLIQGLTLRFKYTNSETSDKEVKINLYLHMKV
jgi:hypothetical protein